MWIRSQDKNVLIDARNVFIDEDFKGEWYTIKTIVNVDDWAILGDYKNKETAHDGKFPNPISCLLALVYSNWISKSEGLEYVVLL